MKLAFSELKKTFLVCLLLNSDIVFLLLSFSMSTGTTKRICIIVEKSVLKCYLKSYRTNEKQIIKNINVSGGYANSK